MFIVAESLVLPVYCNSSASCLRAARLLSNLSSFIKSTIECRQSKSSSDSSASLSMTAATSVCALVGGDAVRCAAAGAEEAGCAAAGAEGDATEDGCEAGGGAACAGPPKIDDMMLPNMLIAALRS